MSKEAVTISTDEIKSLEQFLLDTESLHQIEKRASIFNSFEVLGIAHQEIRHSNVLAWLFDPKETHGLGDYFIRAFVHGTIAQMQDTSSDPKQRLDFALLNYEDVQVKREWQNIDILVISEKAKTVVAIENKIWSGETGDQLKRYETLIDQHFNTYTKMHIFLTPYGEAATRSKTWISLDYSYVLKMIEKGLVYRSSGMDENVRLFLEQYAEIIRRHIVGDKELQELCQEIYKKHKKALDLIYTYKPDLQSDIANKLQEKIETDHELILDHSNKTYIRFTSMVLDQKIKHAGRGWTASKRLLLFEVQNRPDRLMLKLIIGPGQQDLREELHQVALTHPALFNTAKARLNPEFTQIYSKEILKPGYEEDMVLDEVYETIEQQVDAFINGDLKIIQDSFSNQT